MFRIPHTLFPAVFLLLLLPSLLAAQPATQAVILQYHHIGTATPPVTSISAEDFRKHMRYLHDEGFTVLPLEKVVATLQAGGSLPDHTAVITFDDGYSSVFEAAFPVLRDYGWPFTVFISSSLVGSNPGLYASWDQLRAMGAAGATLANHTVTHPYLLERPAGMSDENWLAGVEREIVDAEAEITRQTGQNHKLLAYPYGEYDPAIQALVQKLGYVGIGQHSGPVSAASDFTALPRFPLSGIYAAMNTFTTKMQSLAFAVRIAEPDSPVTSQASPEAVLEFTGSERPAGLSCFNNNQPLSVQVQAGSTQRFRVVTEVRNTARRFHYNCTAPGRDGRYYWFSIPWINPAVADY